jgi:hypothetical protein
MQCAIGTEEKFERNLGLLPIPFKIIQRHHRIVCFGGFFSSLLVKYLSQLAQAHGMPPCVPDPEWPRFNNVRSLIDSILKRKDDEQHISHAMQF